MLFTIDQLRRYRYKIGQCVILAGGEAIALTPPNITGLMILDDYIQNVFPVFKLNLILDSSAFYKISKNKSTLKIHLTIYKYYVTGDSSGETKKTSSYEKWIDDNFCIIPDEVEIKKDTDLDMKNDLSSADTTDDINEWDSAMELYLYREEVAVGMKKRLNASLRNTTLTSVITWALAESGIKNCIMSPLENGKRYDHIFVPPLPINKLLQHLDAMYGFYRCGSMIYFGAKRGYILNFRGGCTAFERGERTETCMLVPQITDIVSAVDGGSVEKGDQKNYIFWEYKDLEFHNPSMVDNVTMGSDALVVNASSGTITSSRSKVVASQGKAATAVINNTTKNEWIDTTFTVQSSSKGHVVRGALANIDLDMLTPNKLFTLVLEDPTQTQSAKGQYKLVGALHKFINDTANGDFSLVSSVEFRRMETTTVSSSVSMSGK